MPSLYFLPHIPENGGPFPENIALKFTTAASGVTPPVTAFFTFREGYRAPLSDKQQCAGLKLMKKIEAYAEII
ncbi:hypothetical protein [Brucella sp. LJL56]